MSAYLEPDAVAERLGVTPKTVRQWLRDGELIGIKLGREWRIDAGDLDRMLAEKLFQARWERAARIHPQHTWIRGQCCECGILMPEPEGRSRWVCSAVCKKSYDDKWASIHERGTEEFAFAVASVVPPY